MLTLSGKVLNIINRSERTTREGKVLDAYTQVQLFITEPMEDGQTRNDVLTMSVPDERPYKALLGKAVSLPVRAYSKGLAVAYVITGDPQPSAS